MMILPPSMGHPKKLKIRLLGTLKDKASIAKSIFSTKSTRISIIRVTIHGASRPPSEHRVAAVLAAGKRSQAAAGACIKVLADRFHGTSDATVALKCLFLAHNIVSKGSSMLVDQLSFVSSSGGLNLSTFRDQTTSETWDVSSWVRWYARVLEKNMQVSRVLGYRFSSLSCNKNVTQKVKLFCDETRLILLSSLLREIDVLVELVEEICTRPDSLNLQRNDLVYEVVRMVSEDYGLAQKEMLPRIEEARDKASEMSLNELTHSIEGLKRLEDCRDGLTLLFVNRKRNDKMWSFVRDTKMELRMRMGTVWKKDESSEVTRFGRRFLESDRFPLLT